MTRTGGRFFLTRLAASDLRAIHTRSRREWGDDIADRYIDGLYGAMRDAAVNPEVGRLRGQRSASFLMVSAQRHFVIYDVIAQGIVVVTVQHQVRDIEALVADLKPVLIAEIERLKRKA